MWGTAMCPMAPGAKPGCMPGAGPIAIAPGPTCAIAIGAGPHCAGATGGVIAIGGGGIAGTIPGGAMKLPVRGNGA
jgi:hypothetical protein